MYTLRGCIRASDKYSFLAMDASQIELRVLAHLSGDTALLEDIKHKDCHQATAVRMYGLTGDKATDKYNRYRAKQGNFAIVYGSGDEQLASLLNCGLTEVFEFRKEHKATYERLYKYIDEAKEQAVELGYVTTMHGRIRVIPDLKSTVRWKLEKAKREAFNTISQGSAVDQVKLMMLWLRGVLVPDVRLVLQIHDEMVWEVPDLLLEDSIKWAKRLIKVFPDYPCDIRVGKYYNELVEVNDA